MKLEQGKFCPLIKKDCTGLQCSWFVQMQGTNPNTGEHVSEWGCAVAWLPMLLVENSNQQRGTSVAVESLRNETHDQAKATSLLFCHLAQSGGPSIEPARVTDLTLVESQG